MSTSWLAWYEMEPLPSHLCPPQSPPGPLSHPSHPGHKPPQEYCWTCSRGRNCASRWHFIRCSSSGNKWPSDSLHCEGVALIGRLQWPTIVWCDPPACQIGSLLFWCCCDCSCTQLLEQSFNQKKFTTDRKSKDQESEELVFGVWKVQFGQRSSSLCMGAICYQ